MRIRQQYRDYYNKEYGRLLSKHNAIASSKGILQRYHVHLMTVSKLNESYDADKTLAPTPRDFIEAADRASKEIEALHKQGITL